MQFLHARERQDFIDENCFGMPEQVDIWINADLVNALTNIDGDMCARTQNALYLIDGFSSDMEELFKAKFKLQPEPERPEGWTPEGYINF